MSHWKFWLLRAAQMARVALLTFIASAAAFSQPSFGDIEEQLPPGFQRHISIDPLLGRLFYEMTLAQNSQWQADHFDWVLKGGEHRGFALKSPVHNANLPTLASQCDGGFVFLRALFFHHLAVTGTPGSGAVIWDAQDEASPSVKPLSSGFAKMINGHWLLAEKDLLNAILVNLFHDDIVKGMYLKNAYLTGSLDRRHVLHQVRVKIDNLNYSRDEFMACKPDSPSVRLMLAQWGAWGLTNSYWGLSEQKGAPYDQFMVNAFAYLEKPLAKKTARIRSQTKTYLNDKY